MLPIIAQTDLGPIGGPGEYPFNDATVRVDDQHLQIWRERPDTRFRTILCTRANDPSTRFVLGDAINPAE